MTSPTSFKVVLLGEGAVGKTSIVGRYLQNVFNNQHIETEQASFVTKKFVIDGHRIELSIWDTAGQERYHALGPMYYRGAHGAILVFDITDEDSFDRVKRWVKELRRMLNDDVLLCIVGNKIDLEKNRHVPLNIVEQYAQTVHAKIYYVSAKLDKGLEELFNDLIQRLIQKYPLPSNTTIVGNTAFANLPVRAQSQTIVKPRSRC